MHNASDGSHLGHITFSDFLDDFAFRDLIMRKLDDLNPADPAHQQLECNVRILLDMIEESKQRRYNGMSLILFGRALVKLDGFLRIQDENPDTRVNGYRDDHAHMKDLCEEFRREIQAFLEWRKSRPDDYVRRAPGRVDLTAYCMSLPVW